MLIKKGIPHLIENSTDGGIRQTSDRRLLARTDQSEEAFQIFLNNGASYRIRLQQVGEVEDAGCQECGTLTALEELDELDEQGYCPDCARDRWDRLTAEEKTTWCKVNKMHWPYEDKGPISAARRRYVSDLLAAHPSRWAKTMPRNPHEYTLRHGWADVGEEVFEEVGRMIQEHSLQYGPSGEPACNQHAVCRVSLVILTRGLDHATRDLLTKGNIFTNQNICSILDSQMMVGLPVIERGGGSVHGIASPHRLLALGWRVAPAGDSPDGEAARLYRACDHGP